MWMVTHHSTPLVCMFLFHQSIERHSVKELWCVCVCVYVLSLATKLLYLLLFVSDNEKTCRGWTNEIGRVECCALLEKKHGHKANFACCWAMHIDMLHPLEVELVWKRNMATKLILHVVRPCIYICFTHLKRGGTRMTRKNALSFFLCSFDCQVLFPTNKYSVKRPLCHVEFVYHNGAIWMMPRGNIVYHFVTLMKREPCFDNPLRFYEASLGPSLHWIKWSLFSFLWKCHYVLFDP